MIKMTDIKNALIILLSSNFYDVHIVSDDISQIKQVGGVKPFPLMHIDLSSFNSNIFDSYTRTESILVDISYIEEEKPSSEKLLEIDESLKRLIGVGLEVKDRFLHIDSISSNVSDDVLHFVFNINFNNGTKDSIKTEATFGEMEIALK